LTALIKTDVGSCTLSASELLNIQFNKMLKMQAHIRWAVKGATNPITQWL